MNSEDCTVFVENLFEEEGLAGYVEMHQYAWEFIPLGTCQTSFNFVLLKVTAYLTLLPGRIKPGIIVLRRTVSGQF